MSTSPVLEHNSDPCSKTFDELCTRSLHPILSKNAFENRDNRIQECARHWDYFNKSKKRRNLDEEEIQQLNDKILALECSEKKHMKQHQYLQTLLQSKNASLKRADQLLEHADQLLMSVLNEFCVKPIPYGIYSQYVEELIDSHSPVYKFVLSSLNKSRVQHRGPNQGDPHRTPPIYTNVRVYRIHNPRLWFKYKAEIEDIFGQCKGRASPIQHYADVCPAPSFYSSTSNPLNEVMLWHGCPTSVADRISKQGLNPLYAGKHSGKLFGRGIYFAPFSSKSDIYTNPMKGSKERVLFFCRVCLGETYETKHPTSDAICPPERKDDRGMMNSICALPLKAGGCVEHEECVIFNSNQCVPLYMVKYTHADMCTCTHCVNKS